jgi:hypothetical protein
VGVAEENSESLSRRDLAVLRAVAQDRCEIVSGSQPVLFIDGRLCCDADSGRRLVHAGLVLSPGGGRGPAKLTPAGRQELDRARAG